MRVYKYGTGHPVPEDALYLTTKVSIVNGVRLVCHYFLVDESEVKK